MSVNKNLAIVTSYPFFGEPVVHNRIASYIRKLSGSGWRITVISPCGARECLESGKKESFDGQEIVYVITHEYNRRNLIKRGLNEIICSLRLLKRARTAKRSVLIVTIPSMFLLLFALKRFAFVQIVDVRDLAWEYIPRIPWWNNVIRYVLRELAILALRRADIVSVSNPHELSYLERRLPQKRLVLVSNGIGMDQFSIISKIKKIEGDANILRITYVGNIGLAQDLTTLVRAVGGGSQFEVNIIGYGTDFERVLSEVERLGVHNVHLHGRIPWEEVAAWYEKSDVLYTQLTSEFNTAMPSKLYEYLATGLPVIYGGSGAAVRILDDFENVIVVPPSSEQELRAALNQMFQGRVKQCQENIDRIRQGFIREDHVGRLEKEVEGLLTGF